MYIWSSNIWTQSYSSYFQQKICLYLEFWSIFWKRRFLKDVCFKLRLAFSFIVHIVVHLNTKFNEIWLSRLARKWIVQSYNRTIVLIFILPYICYECMKKQNIVFHFEFHTNLLIFFKYFYFIIFYFFTKFEILKKIKEIK